MKTTGIILIIIGALSTMGGMLSISNGRPTSSPFAGLTFVVLGAFLISRDSKKKEEEQKKKQWENESD
ncbi:MAG: hypothetical protein GY810_10170 [Aureispira sp.]|nr:hypothetical protein [Aureispira sp.]